MCKCGCNKCDIEIKGPVLKEHKIKSLLSKDLRYHINKNIPLYETKHKVGSIKYLSLIKEARKVYSRSLIDLCKIDEVLVKTNLGEFALFEGKRVPLDLPLKVRNSKFMYIKEGKEIKKKKIIF